MKENRNNSSAIHSAFLRSAFLFVWTGVAVLCVSCISADPALREIRVSTFSPAETVAWKSATTSRAAAIEDCSVLDRLAGEESEEIAEAAQTLRSKYGIDPERSYTYHAETLSIVETAVTTEGQRVEIPHRTFSTAADAEAFVALVTEKQEASNRLAILRELQTAKKRRLDGLETFLKKTFHVDPAVSYRLDEATRTLWKPVSLKEWEAVRAEEKAKVAAARKAEEETRRKLREEADSKVRSEHKAKSESEAKAEREKAKSESEAKTEREKAKSESEAKKAAERKAREEAEAKAKAEREKARAEARAKAEAERKAREEAEAKAIRAEEEALAAFIEKTVAERKAQRDRAAKAKSAAETRAESAAKVLAEKEAFRSRLKSEGRMTDLQRERLAAQLSAAKASYAEAEASVKSAKKDYSAAEDSLSRAEKDARKAFYKSLRAQGRKPLTEPGGFFSWF